MMKHFFTLLIFFIQLQTVHAQVTDSVYSSKETKKTERKARNKYLITGTGLGYEKITDRGTSPLLYKGMMFANGSLGYMVHSVRIIKSFGGEIGYGNLRSGTVSPWYNPRTTSYLLSLRFNFLTRICPQAENRFRYFIGPEININGHFRLNYKYENSAFNFDYFNGIGIAGRVEYPFSYKAKKFRFLGLKLKRRNRDLIMSLQLSIPVASLIVRPSYVTVSHFTVPELREKLTADLIRGGLFVPFNIRAQTSLRYILHNGNALRINYIWEFYSHDPGYNKIQSAFHGLYFSFFFKFNKEG